MSNESAGGGGGGGGGGGAGGTDMSAGKSDSSSEGSSDGSSVGSGDRSSRDRSTSGYLTLNASLQLRPPAVSRKEGVSRKSTRNKPDVSTVGFPIVLSAELGPPTLSATHFCGIKIRPKLRFAMT